MQSNSRPVGNSLTCLCDRPLSLWLTAHATLRCGWSTMSPAAMPSSAWASGAQLAYLRRWMLSVTG